MVIELSILIAIVGCFVGVAGFMAGRDKRIAGDSEWKGSVNARLDAILKSIADQSKEHAHLEGRVDEAIEKTDKEIHALDRRVTITEQSVKSAHKRIDAMDGK